jgi:hypothetical protein
MATSKTTNTYNRQNWEDAVSKQPFITRFGYSEYDITSRYYRVLTMVYNTQRYWVFGLCPSSGYFLNNNEKTRFGNWICFRPQVREDTYSVGSLRKS